MKTLDEVIQAVDYCRFSSDCNPCPYRESKSCAREKMTDALHYLKEYKKLDSLEAVAFPEDDNPPLTWDELKQMEGKPVWLEVKGYNGCWTIVHWNSNIVFVEFYDWIASPDDFMKAPLVSLDDTNFGTAWQAYRKER